MKPSSYFISAVALTTATYTYASQLGIQGVTDPGVPAGYLASEIIWDGGGSEDWNGTALRIDLSAGSFYQSIYGGDGAVPQAAIDLFPELEFDTHVGITGDSTAFIPGGAGDVGGGPFSMDAPQLSVSWANLDHMNIGVERVGMVTLSDDAIGTGSMYYPGGYTLNFIVNNGHIPTSFMTVQSYPGSNNNEPPGPFPEGLPYRPPQGSTLTTATPVNSPDVPDGYVANQLIWDGQGVDWFGSAIRLDLTSGEVYQHPLGFDHAPSGALIATDPVLEYDTYFGVVDDVTGGINSGADPLNAPTLAIEDQHISVHWFNNHPGDTNWMRIGMITLSEDANGVIAFRNGRGTEWSTVIVDGVIINPEPASLTLLSMAGVALLIRR